MRALPTGKNEAQQASTKHEGTVEPEPELQGVSLPKHLLKLDLNFHLLCRPHVVYEPMFLPFTTAATPLIATAAKAITPKLRLREAASLSVAFTRATAESSERESFKLRKIITGTSW